MKRTVLFAVPAAILAAGTILAQAPAISNPAADAPQAAPAQSAAQTPAAGRGRGNNFGPPPVLGPDDTQAFPDPPAGFTVRRDIPHGQLSQVPYDSKTLGTRRRLTVYLPAGYSADHKYPSLYLIHGLGWDDLEWTAIRHIDVELDNLIADGKVPPTVVIFPNGDSTMTLADIEANGGGPRMNPGNAQHPPAGAAGSSGADPAGASGGRQGMSMEPWRTPFENDLLKDIIPFVESHYSIYGDRDHRALGGLSMGGGQALNIGIVHPETFGYVGGFSSAPDTKNPPDLVPDPALPKQLKLLWVSGGSKDGLLRISQGVHAYLKEKGVPHVYNVDGNAHDTPEWQNNFYYFSQRLFK